MRDRDAEIGDLHRAVIFHQHVLRLDVPVDDMFFMGHGDRAGQLQHDVYRLIQVQCAALGDQLLERPSADIFHDDIMFSLAFPDIVDIHDIRVRELAGRSSVIGSSARSPRRILMATTRFRMVSIALYTSAMPPCPTHSRS